MDDKLRERLRYDARSELVLREGVPGGRLRQDGAAGIEPIYRAPYLYYEGQVRRFVEKGARVLEIGAGSGMHTGVIASTGAAVVATDVSVNSLELLRRRCLPNVEVVAADMEFLPFRADSFDVVACAGSLSYGGAGPVDAEVRRVLKPGGTFICVDSLNDNAVYRLNRWIGYLRGLRTSRTLRCMPDERRIRAISTSFRESSVCYFGAIAMLTPALARVLGQHSAARISDAFDRLIGTRRSAFKFVLVARGRR